MIGPGTEEIRGRQRLVEMGERIRVSRLKAGFRTNVDLARAVNVSEASMSAYVRGLQRPSHEILARIAVAVKTSADWLLHGDEKPEEEAAPPSFSKEALSQKVNFYALVITLIMCQEWFQRLQAEPTLKETLDWVGHQYDRARESIPDRPIRLEDPEGASKP